MIAEIFSDALFAAIAAIGFAAINRPPRHAYFYCAVIAAVGHSVRFVLLNYCGETFSIVFATFIAALVVGTLAVFLSPVARTPAETCLFPALLPMIPGIYAYKTFAGLGLCLMNGGETAFNHNFYVFASNGLICVFILAAMVVGATLPIFIFSKISFQATR